MRQQSTGTLCLITDRPAERYTAENLSVMTAGQQAELLAEQADYLTETYKHTAIHSCQHVEMKISNL